MRAARGRRLGQRRAPPRRSVRNPTTGLTSTALFLHHLTSGMDLRDPAGRSAARAAVSRAWRTSRRTTTRCRASLRAARGLASAASRGIRSSRPRKPAVNRSVGTSSWFTAKRRGTRQIGPGAVSRQPARGRVGPLAGLAAAAVGDRCAESGAECRTAPARGCVEAVRHRGRLAERGEEGVGALTSVALSGFEARSDFRTWSISLSRKRQDCSLLGSSVGWPSSQAVSRSVARVVAACWLPEFVCQGVSCDRAELRDLSRGERPVACCGVRWAVTGAGVSDSQAAAAWAGGAPR